MLNEVYLLGNIIQWVGDTIVIVCNKEQVSVVVSGIKLPENFGNIVEDENVCALKGKIKKDKVYATKLQVLDSVNVD